MAKINTKPLYGYREDNSVPPFTDDKPLFIFDGVCVLCSGTVGWFMRRDKHDSLRYATAQSPLGQAIYKYYGIDMNETYLLIDKGSAYGKSDGYLHLVGLLGGWWGLLKLFYIFPRALRDYGYDVVARNRYKWFGKTGYCQLIDDTAKARIIQ